MPLSSLSILCFRCVLSALLFPHGSPSELSSRIAIMAAVGGQVLTPNNINARPTERVRRRAAPCIPLFSALRAAFYRSVRHRQSSVSIHARGRRSPFGRWFFSTPPAPLQSPSAYPPNVAAHQPRGAAQSSCSPAKYRAASSSFIGTVCRRGLSAAIASACDGSKRSPFASPSKSPARSTRARSGQTALPAQG